MKSLRYCIYDVFTDTRLTGNPLAVVFDANALDELEMQAVAGEFNLAETVFIRAPAENRHTASARIFTPKRELPFAGHPTIGAAVALAESRHGRDQTRNVLIVLEENVGPVRCAVKIDAENASFCAFDAPMLSQPAGEDPNIEMLAAAIGLDARDIGFDRHLPTTYSAGTPFTFAPVRDVDALARAKAAPDLDLTFVYTRAADDAPEAFRARMFAPASGIVEDPATGGAVAALAGVLARFEALPDGWSDWPVLQGVEMGRPSRIGLEVQSEHRVLTGARITGQAIRIAEGKLFL